MFLKKLLHILIPLAAFLFLYLNRVQEPFSQSLSLSETRYFDQDEFEHTQAAWNLSIGLVPYRDFFEHHTPLLYFQLAPIISDLKPEKSIQAAVRTLMICRQVMNVWAVGLVAALIMLAYCWLGRIAGLFVGVGAACFLCNINVFWSKVIEIRPDTAAVCLSLVSLSFLVSGLQNLQVDTTQPEAPSLRWSFAKLIVGGMLISCAIQFTPKVLFLAPGFALFWICYLADNRWGLHFRMRLIAVCCTVVGAAIPLLLTSAWFYRNNALGDFYFYTVSVNLNWQNKFSPQHFLQELFEKNSRFIVMGVLGLIIVGIFGWSKSGIKRADPLVLLVAVSAIVGIWLNPEPYYQYHLHFLPFLALTCSAFWYFVIARVVRSKVTALKMLRIQERDALTILLFAAVVYSQTPVPSVFTVDQKDLNNQQLQVLSWSFHNSAADDVILEDFPMNAIFRKQAWFYGVLHDPIFSMISEREKAQFSQDLINLKIKPRIIADRRFIRRMPLEFQTYIWRNYIKGFESYLIRRK